MKKFEQMELWSSKYVTTSGYTGSSKFDFWQNLEIGDELQVHSKIPIWGKPVFTVHNLTKKQKIHVIGGTVEQYLRKCSLQAYEDLGPK